MSVTLLIFDLDGTLVDSSRDITDALNHAIKPYTPHPLTVEQTRTLIGEGVTKLIGKVARIKDGDFKEEILLKRFLDYYSAHLADHSTPYRGVPETLAQLKKYTKAVLSNKNESLSVGCLDLLDLTKYFDYIAGGDTSMEKKPSPVPVLSILTRFGVDRNDALLIGDSIYDIEAGRNAGIRTVAALYGYGSPGFADKADFTINSFPELPDLLSSL